MGFGTSCKFDREEKLEENIAAAKEAVDVCVRMGIPAVRVFGNDIPEPSRTLETALPSTRYTDMPVSSDCRYMG